MIRNLVIALALLVSSLLQGQTIQWQKNYGGSEFDIPSSIITTIDGGYIVAGQTASMDGDVPGNLGVYDFWIVKLDSVGNMEWSTVLGGNGNDYPKQIAQTADGGYLIAGTTGSDNLPGFHDDRDAIIIKINHSGVIEWQKLLGGSKYDEGVSFVLDTTGKITLLGSSSSIDGDCTGTKGSLDLWLVQLDELGNILWQKKYGGSHEEYAHALIRTTDGGFLAVGETISKDGDIGFNNGNVDYWVLKTDNNGDIIWSKPLGGAGLDVGTGAIELGDFYYITGYEGSGNSGDVNGHYGLFDGWVVKLDKNGSIIWRRNLGGSKDDYVYSSMKATDSNICIFGSTDSKDGIVTDNDGLRDSWIAVIDTNGAFMWQKTMGGIQAEVGFALTPSNDGSLVLASYSWSDDGDVSLNHGYSDYWIVKLAQPTSNAGIPSISEIKLFPNPAQDQLELNFPEGFQPGTITVLNLAGKPCLMLKENESQHLDISSLAEGFYLIDAVDVQGRHFSARFVKVSNGRG